MSTWILLYRYNIVLYVCLYSFSEDGVETAETAYALALAYANVQNDDAESMSPDTALLLPVLATSGQTYLAKLYFRLGESLLFYLSAS